MASAPVITPGTECIRSDTRDPEQRGCGLNSAPSSGWQFLFGRTSLLTVGLCLTGLLSLRIYGAEQDIIRSAQVEKQSSEQIEVRGRIVCLLEEMNQLHGTELMTKHEHLFALKTADGKYYTILRGKVSECIYVDERIRAKELIIKGRTFPGTLLLEPSRMRSVRNGVVHDFYYYCVICSIETMWPGECMCCQGPNELIEKSL